MEEGEEDGGGEEPEEKYGLGLAPLPLPVPSHCGRSGAVLASAI